MKKKRQYKSKICYAEKPTTPDDEGKQNSGAKVRTNSTNLKFNYKTKKKLLSIKAVSGGEVVGSNSPQNLC